MNRFTADILLDEEKNLRPFSSTQDQGVFQKTIERFKSKTSFTSDEYIDCLWSIYSRTQFAVKNNPPIAQSVFEHIITLQGLVAQGETCENDDFEPELVDLAKQLFLKTGADLLAIRKGGISLEAKILHELSFHAVASSSFSQTEVAAFSAMLVTESLSILASIDSQVISQNLSVYDMPERLVSALAPLQGSVCLLHPKVFVDALEPFTDTDVLDTSIPPDTDNTRTSFLARRISPLLDDSNIFRLLVNMLVQTASAEAKFLHFSVIEFFTHLFQNIPRWPSEKALIEQVTPDSLSASDIGVFLRLLAEWCRMSSTDLFGLSCRLPLTVEQIRLWKQLMQYLSAIRNKKPINPANLIAVKAIIEITRMRKICPNVKIPYGVFKWMEHKGFSNDWLHLYATSIKNTIIGFRSPTFDHILNISASSPKATVSVEEEEEIINHLNRYLGTRMWHKGNMKEAERFFSEISSGAYDLKIKFYLAWASRAVGDDRKYVEDKLNEMGYVPSVSPTIPLDPSPIKVPVPFSPPSTSHRPPFRLASSGTPVWASTDASSPIHLERSMRSIQSQNTDQQEFVTPDTSFQSEFTSPVHQWKSPHQNDGMQEIKPPSIQHPRVSPPEEPNPAKLQVLVNEDRQTTEDICNETTFNLQETDDEDYYLELLSKRTESLQRRLKEESEQPLATSKDVAAENKENELRRMREHFEAEIALLKKKLEEKSKNASPLLIDRTIGPSFFSPDNTMNAFRSPEAYLDPNDTMTMFHIAQPTIPAPPVQTITKAHPGETECCLGCLDDERQDKALRILSDLTVKWINYDSD